MINQEYVLVNIYKEFGSIDIFHLLLYSDIYETFRVADSQTRLVGKGAFFKGDLVKIVVESQMGVEIELVEQNYNDGIEEKYDLSYLLINRWFRFQNHTLPFNVNAVIPTKVAKRVEKDGKFLSMYTIDDENVPSLSEKLSHKFVCRVVKKTRISSVTNNFNPFFFVIGHSNNVFIKIIFWLENLAAYSTLKVGDLIYVSDFKKKIKTPSPSKLIFNNLTESFYFDLDEVTVKTLYKLKLEPEITIPIAYNSYGTPFIKIEGNIIYVSVLLKYRVAETILEYYLIKIKDENGNIKQVVLFNNSDDLFYQIKGGYIILEDMRKVERGSFTYYLSTLYTQISLKEEIYLIDPIGEDNKKKSKKVVNEYIQGALGYIPDRVSSIDLLVLEETEKINGKSLSVEGFLDPIYIEMDKLYEIDLVINETKKVYFKGKVKSVIKSEMAVSYTENGETKDQNCLELALDNGVELLMIENFYLDKKIEFDKKDLLFKNSYIFVEAFRSDSETILYYLTGYLNLNRNNK